MKWFGQAWAPVCDPDSRVDTPVGQQCAECERAVAEGDSGVILPGADGLMPWHRVCFLRTVIPCGLWDAELLADLPPHWAAHRAERHPEAAQ